MPEQLLLAIMGPTASGKTRLAEAVSRETGAILINADAFQIYRHLDIGTAKPSNRALYGLMDIREPNEAFGVGEWTRLAQDQLVEAYDAGKSVIVVGGTGLYIRALFEQYSDMAAQPDAALREALNAIPIEELRLQLSRDHPEIAATTDLANPVRVRRAFERLHVERGNPIKLPPFRKLKLALIPEPEVLNARIAQRLAQMMHNGWTQEVEQLRAQGFQREDPGLRAIGYRAIWDHLERKISLEEATTTTITETRRYAKRQRTWLRSEPGLQEISATAEGDAVRLTMQRIESILV